MQDAAPQALAAELGRTRLLLREFARLPGFGTSVDDKPVVLCLLRVKDRGDIKLARRAVDQFVDQVYPLRHLWIVNTSGVPVTNRAHVLITESLAADAIGPLGWTHLFPFWTPGHAYDPCFLSFMVAKTEPGVDVVALTGEIRVTLNNSAVEIGKDATGLSDCVLLAKGVIDDNTHEPYDSWKTWLRGNLRIDARTRLVETDQYPLTTLRTVVTRGVPTPGPGTWACTVEEALYVKRVVSQFGIDTAGTPEPGPSSD